jgi:predicted aldo/keto reductase-like oxidoreductase
MFGEFEASLFSYAIRMSGDLTTGDPGFASQCITCGECLEKCPQGIQIPDLLADVAAEMEGPGLQERVARAAAMLKADS